MCVCGGGGGAARGSIWPTDYIVYSCLTYGIEIWGGAKKCITNKIEIVRNRAAKCIALGHYMDSTSPIFKWLHFLKLHNLRDLYFLKQLHRYYNDCGPLPLQKLFLRSRSTCVYGTRQRANPRETKCSIARSSFVWT